MHRKIAATVTALVVLVLAAVPSAAAPASITQVPYTMDSSNQAAWWTPLETYVGGNSYAYLAFNEPGSQADRHRVAIARRDGSGAWTRIPVMNGTAQAEYVDDIGHNQPSMARDGSGRFHVFASMHSGPWRYFRSDTTGGAPQNRSSTMPDQGRTVTYPVLTTAPNGDVYLMARIDAEQRQGRLYRWNNAASTWSLVAVLGSAENRTFYPDDLEFDENGDLHILWEWSLSPSSALRHELSYLRYRPASDSFVDHRGNGMTVPVSPATADKIQPMEQGEVYASGGTGPAVQSAKLTVDGASPKVVYRYRSSSSSGRFTVRYAYAGASGDWVRSTVYSATQTRAALGITWHPTEEKRVYFVTESGTDRVQVATNNGSTWSLASVAPGLPIERLAVERDATGTDVLYLADPVSQRLYYGRN